MFSGHNPYLVALSVVTAILGGYTGFGLAARVRGIGGLRRRVLLGGAAALLAVSIWTMHFIGILAAPIPESAVYLVLPTVVSFLICALVVGVSLFFVSIGAPSELRVAASALLLGIGIASMHYVGMSALVGDFHMAHDHWIVIGSVLIAIGAGYGGLHIFLARQGGTRLAMSAVAFGIAVSGMHYTAMYGMHFLPDAIAAHKNPGLAASPQTLALVVALLCFLIVASFLLFLVPEPRAAANTRAGLDSDTPDAAVTAAYPKASPDGAPLLSRKHPPLPLGGLGQPRPETVDRLPVEGANGTHFVETGEIRSIQADAHYTRVHDGSRERMCSWSISHAEAMLDPAQFVRVHRSHIVALRHIATLRKEGDGAIIEMSGPVPHLVPVSRPKVAGLRARLGLISRRRTSDDPELGQTI